MVKEDVVYLYSGILFNHEKEGNPTICKSKDGPWAHHAEWNKSDRERQMLYDLTSIGHLKKAKLIETEGRMIVF